MLGCIYTIDTYEGIKRRKDILLSPWNASELQNLMPKSYYVSWERDSFKQDCQLFAEHYNVFDYSRFVSLSCLEAGIKQWTAFEVEIDPLISFLNQKKQERLARIKQEIESDNPDLWLIKETAWDASRFWFIWEVNFEPEMGLLEYLLEVKSYTKSILITESFRYYT